MPAPLPTLSRQVFDDVVRQGHVSVQPSDFAKVSVQVKEFQDEAWVKVVGVAPSRRGVAGQARGRQAPGQPSGTRG